MSCFKSLSLNHAYKCKIFVCLQGTPTLVSSLDLGILLSKESPLRVLSYGGESFPSLDTLRQHRHPDNVTEVFNLYGITEVSCWASCYKLSFADDE